jgi:hypothetical protein
MSFIKLSYDQCSLNKQLQESTGPGIYMLDTPTPTKDRTCFVEDPFIRLQKWGANVRTNTTNIESDLYGLTRNNTKDCISKNQYNLNKVNSVSITYPICDQTTEQTRVTHPAWEIRDLEQTKRYILPLNPQENTCLPFHNNLSTRIIEKNSHVTHIPCTARL